MFTRMADLSKMNKNVNIKPKRKQYPANSLVIMTETTEEVIPYINEEEVHKAFKNDSKFIDTLTKPCKIFCVGENGNIIAEHINPAYEDIIRGKYLF